MEKIIYGEVECFFTVYTSETKIWEIYNLDKIKLFQVDGIKPLQLVSGIF